MPRRAVGVSREVQLVLDAGFLLLVNFFPFEPGTVVGARRRRPAITQNFDSVRDRFACQQVEPRYNQWIRMSVSGQMSRQKLRLNV